MYGYRLIIRTGKFIFGSFLGMYLLTEIFFDHIITPAPPLDEIEISGGTVVNMITRRELNGLIHTTSEEVEGQRQSFLGLVGG